MHEPLAASIFVYLIILSYQFFGESTISMKGVIRSFIILFYYYSRAYLRDMRVLDDD